MSVLKEEVGSERDEVSKGSKAAVRVAWEIRVDLMYVHVRICDVLFLMGSDTHRLERRCRLSCLLLSGQKNQRHISTLERGTAKLAY